MSPRNAVLRMDVLQKIIRNIALMGINQLMLYTEDTFEIPGEPFFGYFRGGYTQKELKAIDDYAFQFGIEVVPCIQTLGHLEQVLHWPCYRHMQDTAAVLLAGDPKAEELIVKMIDAAAAPFRSRRIHIGMDEAHGIGAGKYRLRNGLKPPFEILVNHLQRVTDLCRERGLSPMIWSDMFFRLGSKDNQYYDRNSTIPTEAANKVASDVEVIYWDYYHTDTAFYDDWIARHRAMGKEPIFAAGIWTWNRFWASLPHTMATIRAGMAAARRNRLQETFITMWGDDGVECDYFSALPGIQFFAEMAYAPDHADAALEIHFRGSCNGTGSAWIAASRIDNTPDIACPDEAHPNTSKWLLWHDPVLNYLDHHIPATLPAHYAEVAAECALASERLPEDGRLAFIAQLSRVLSLKARLHLMLRPAYQQGDKASIREILDTLLPQIRDGVRSLWKAHRSAWHARYRPFGWEIIEGRYGALTARLETLDDTLRGWLEEPSEPIEELACESRPVHSEDEKNQTILYYHASRSPSRIF